MVERVYKTHFLAGGGLLVRENITSQSVLFESGFVKPILAAFDQPASSSDGGALLLKLADDRLRLTTAVAGALPDEREAGKVKHSLLNVIQQRVMGIGNGYEDANDASRLRGDPTHQLLLGRAPGAGSELASQPTISRLENAFGEEQVRAAVNAFTCAVLNRHRRRLRKKAKRIIIDVDATWDDAHGEQQGALFNSFYRNHGFLPLLAFAQFDDENEQYLLAALLRPGNAGNDEVMSFLVGVIEQVRRRFPTAELTLRADAGFALPAVFEYLDDHQVRYAIGMGSSSALKAYAAPGMQIARALSEASGDSERVYVDEQYQTQKSWPHSRRVIIKAEVTRYPGRTPRDNARFVITDLAGSADFIYESVYSRRGDVENRIKELKGAIRMDRTSCTSFAANQLRVLLHAVAFALYQEIRLAAAGTSFATAQVATIRERLIKLGAWFKTATRRIVIHLPETAPWRGEWVTIAGRLAAPPT